jgi:hypothetical protein
MMPLAPAAPPPPRRKRCCHSIHLERFGCCCAFLRHCMRRHPELAWRHASTRCWITLAANFL